MLGIIDFAGSEHWAPFSFPKSTALPSPSPPPSHQVKEGPYQVHLLRPYHSINRSRENRSKATKGKLRGRGEGTRLGMESDYLVENSRRWALQCGWSKHWQWALSHHFSCWLWGKFPGVIWSGHVQVHLLSSSNREMPHTYMYIYSTDMKCTNTESYYVNIH